MAITAQFTADFSQFNGEVEQADKKLQTLEGHSKQAADSVGNWSQSLSIAAGYLGALGIDASISGMVNFTKAVFASADELQRLHDQTGISVENLQRLQGMASDSGNSLSQITDAITKMQVNIGSGSKATLDALTTLKVPLEDIRNMSGDERWFAIGEALAGVEDPALQAALAVDIFGKAGTTVLPSIKAGFDGVKDSAVGMSRATVQSLDDVGDALGHLTSTAQGFAGTVLGRIFFGWAYDAKVFEEQLKDVKKPLMDLPEPLKALTISTTEQANIERVLGERLKETEDAAKAAKAEEKALADFRESASKRQFEIMEAQKKDALATAGIRNEQVKLELDAQAKLNESYGLDVMGRQKMTSAAQTYYDKLAALQQLKEDGFQTAAREQQLMKDYSDAMLEEAKALDDENQAFWKARDAVKAKGDAVEETTRKTGVYMQQLHMLVDDPKLAAFFGNTAQGAAATTLYSGGQAGITPEMAAAMAAGQFIQMSGVGAIGLQKRAAGGPVTGGTPYLVGERGPELIVPSGNARVIPTHQINNFQVNGTAEDVARKIFDILSRSVRQGQRFGGA